ncbi:MAG: HEPN domain-containing protein [Candidatus Parvarchaeum sp.]
MEYWEELLDYANNDLNASELLYENNDYRNAIYHLQQANEKTAKSCLVKMGMIKNDEVASKFGHAWHRTLTTLVQKIISQVPIVLNTSEAELIKFLSGKANPSPANEEIIELCKYLQQFIEQVSNPNSNTKNEINQKLDNEEYKNIFSEQNILKLFDNFSDSQLWYQFSPKEAKEPVKSLSEAQKKEYIKKVLEEKGGNLYDYTKKIYLVFIY